jgi:tRNA(fMet)-specific endonuclease VapC
MTYLIDSDLVADFLVAKPQATELLLALAKEGMGVSLITIGEIYEGIYYGRDPHKAEAVFRQFLRMAETIPLTQTIMQRFAQIRGELRRKGQIIGDFDILIAATALHHDLIVVTRNTKDYQRIPQLRLYQ